MFLLKGTKLRRKLLACLFGQPEKSYYVRELAAGINEDPGNLSRELRYLEEEGVVRSEKRGSLKFYSINRDYAYRAELEKIVSKAEGFEDGLKKMLAEFAEITFAFIYGAYARDREKRSADVDLVVVGPVDESIWAGRVRTLEGTFNKRIHCRVYSTREFGQEKGREGSFLNSVLREKVILL
jgi:DNA-binding transcriptional ArsR family regulator